MKRKRKRTREERFAERLRTDPVLRRLADRIEEGRTDEERAAFPLGSEAFSRETRRQLEERIQELEEIERRREAS
jgi:hypothetical protein